MPINLEILQVNQESNNSFMIHTLQLNDCLAVFVPDEGLAVETSN